MSISAVDSRPGAASHAPRRWSLGDANPSETVDLSETRAFDCALEILRAYKITGNFPIDLEIVLDDLAARDQVTFEILPKSALSDCRHVKFRAAENVDNDRFDTIVRAIKNRIGFDPAPRLWARLFR